MSKSGMVSKGSWFENEMSRAMGRHGVYFERSVPVGPFELDFLWRGKVFDVAVETDGGSHAAEAVARKDIARDRYFEEFGVRTFRIPYWSWREVRPLVEMDLLTALSASLGEATAPTVEAGGGLFYDKSWWEGAPLVGVGPKTRFVARTSSMGKPGLNISLEELHEECRSSFASKNPLVAESNYYRQVFRYKFMYLVDLMREGL